MKTIAAATIATLASLFLCVTAGNAPAQTYPNKAVRIVVPYAPGGPVDTLARHLSPHLAERIGGSIVIDNRPGGATAIGTDHVAKAAPDGYTLLLGTVSTHAMNPALNKVPFDPVKDFTAISLVASMPFVLVVHPAVPANTVGELIALAKQKKGALTYASAGSGTSNHLAGELFKSMLGLDIVHVAYKGIGPAQIDVIGGRVDMMFDTTITAFPRIKSGQTRGLAVTSPKRLPTAPELPTIAESGAEGFAVDTWFGVFAPAGTSPEIVARLNRELVAIVGLPEVQERFSSMGVLPLTSTPDEFSAHVRTELGKWTKVVQTAGITQE